MVSSRYSRVSPKRPPLAPLIRDSLGAQTFSSNRDQQAAVVTLMNFGALARLMAAILAGHAGSGQTLLLDAANIWITNVIIFALWFWGSP